MAKHTEEFIQKILPYALEVQEKYNIPASLVIAQAALESGWGKRAIGNNYFGIKADKRWSGEAVSFDTHEIADGKRFKAVCNFRAYDSMRDSVLNYGHFLATSNRYKNVIGSGNGFAAADAVDAGGYATGSNYAKHVKDIIRSNNLTQYDGAKFQGYSNDGNEKQFDGLLGDLMKFLSGLFSIFGGKNAIANVDLNSITAPALPRDKSTSKVKS